MNNYEAMVIIKPEVNDQEKKVLCDQIRDVIPKFNGTVNSATIWSERKKLAFPIKKCSEGIYFLVQFSAPSEAIKNITYTYKLNESIVRVLITRLP
jgi:small subunit ribosomal protein S6